MSSNPLPLTFAEFQAHIHARYSKVDRERGWSRTFAYLVEEVGELATALSRESDVPQDRANLEEEFADVIAWLCTLANVAEVDLAAAVSRKYLGDAPPKGTK